MKSAKLILDEKEYELPLVVGSEKEVGLDISKLRSSTGAITSDNGYGNTGSCHSAITFIDGEKGILRYRGFPIEDLARPTTSRPPGQCTPRQPTNALPTKPQDLRTSFPGAVDRKKNGPHLETVPRPG